MGGRRSTHSATLTGWWAWSQDCVAVGVGVAVDVAVAVVVAVAVAVVGVAPAYGQVLGRDRESHDHCPAR